MYTIAGTTGRTGKVAAEALLARGEKVRVIVRDAAKAASLARRGAEVVIADLADPQALARALEGSTAAYLLVPPNHATNDFRAYQAVVGASLATAVAASRVPRVVLLSSVGAHLSSGTGPIAALHRVENDLRAIAGLDLVLVRAGYFVENIAASLGALRDGVFPTFFPASFPIDAIATADIGALVAERLVARSSGTSIVELGGPAITMADVAGAISRVVGRTVPVVEAPLAALVPTCVGAGMTEDLAKLYLEMTEGFVAGKITWEGGHERVRGTTPLDTVVRGLVSPAT